MFEDSAEIYVITNKINNKKYVGQATCYLSNGKDWGTQKRWEKHLYQAHTGKCECRLLEYAIRKYCKKSFLVDIVLECGLHEANQYEIEYIEKYNTLVPNGYNLMTGGENGRKHSDETKQRMSITRTGKKHKEDTKKLIGQAHKNKKVTENTRKLIGKTSRYRNMSKENRDRIQTVLDIKQIDNLPIYINYIRYKSRNSEGFHVRHPQIKNKKFISKQLTLIKKYELAQEYIVNQRLSV